MLSVNLKDAILLILVTEVGKKFQERMVRGTNEVFGNFREICSVTLTSARHADFSHIKDAYH